jgi:class 3 adenylate cyclase
MRSPPTSYAVRPDGVNIAYQAVGDGPRTIVWCWGWISHLDLQWTDPGLASFFRRLASFSRLVVFDKAGTGLSDPIAHPASLEERVEDIRAVMDAAGVDRATLLGESEGGPSAALFAATCPDRTESLILWGMVPKGRATDDELEPYGGSRDGFAVLTARMLDVIDHWGEGRTVDVLAPSIANPITRRALGTFERSSVSRGMARGLIDGLLAMDVTPALAAITVPTLVLHRTGDVVPIACGRMVAAAIPGARFVELPGTDHAFWTQDPDAVIGEIEHFVTGARATAAHDRVLATVLFTDIADSTSRAAAMGDAAWRALLERHDELVGEHVATAGGRVVKSLGDGALAVFPGPARAIRCASALLDDARELDLALRAGIHTGECEAVGDDLGGLAVHIGARVGALAQPGEVLVSGTVKELVVGSGMVFEDRGEHQLKGVPGAWRLYALSGGPVTPASPLAPAAEAMTASDRMTVRLARRAPGALRAVGRIAQRGRRDEPAAP